MKCIACLNCDVDHYTLFCRNFALSVATFGIVQAIIGYADGVESKKLSATFIASASIALSLSNLYLSKRILDKAHRTRIVNYFYLLELLLRGALLLLIASLATTFFSGLILSNSSTFYDSIVCITSWIYVGLVWLRY